MADEPASDAPTGSAGPHDGRRKLGLLRGKVWEAPDAWDPDPELERLFYDGGPNFRSTLDDYLDDLAAQSREGEAGTSNR